MSDVIRELCERYTDLTQEEISTIQDMCAVLQPLANLEDADIFVDCPCSDKVNAIVVAEAKPSYVPSSYKKTVVGLLAMAENEPAVARTFRLGVATKQMKATTQENGQTIQTVEPIFNQKGTRVIGVLIQEKREEEARPVPERIHFSQESYEKIANVLSHMTDDNNWLAECINEGLVMVDKNGIVTFRNSIARDIYEKLGYLEDPLGKPYNNFSLAPNAGDRDEYGDFSSVDVLVSGRSLVLRRIALKDPGMDYAVTINDVTLQKEQEKQIMLKTVAIKEMHHRVKNNLQVIASLLRIQARRTDSAETRKVLAESLNRILSIATTHELLARSGVDQVQIGEVVQNVKNSTIRYFASPSFHVKVTVEGGEFEVDSDVATSVALIINELLQNSLEYAYQDGEEGLVRIIITQGELYSRIQVIDDGCGFDLNNVRKNRLGLSIVQTLVKDKLRGNLEIASGPEGTAATFDFKNSMIDIVGALE